ncbi:hypothetical protein [Alloscardovia omnicolens]|uniref:hypothetical protein n=1 Tax=Alloscardovia omnicolens TaxID=419015 RepID=UPI003A64C8FE
MATAEARSIRSSQARRTSLSMNSSAVRSTRPSTRSTVSDRPQLRVNSREDTRFGTSLFNRVQAIAHNRQRSFVVLMTSVIFLVTSLGVTLFLRTEMTKNAFSITETQNSVVQLTQDVQQDRAKLNKLESQLPQRAMDMGMQQGSSSMTIDLGNAQ